MPDEEKPILCKFLIPLERDGNRAKHAPSCWNALHDALFACFHGFTGPVSVLRLRKTMPGQYKSEGKGRVEDECRQYEVALPSNRVDELRQVMRKAANTFDQEEIFLAVRGEVEFVAATEEDGFLTDLGEA